MPPEPLRPLRVGLDATEAALGVRATGRYAREIARAVARVAAAEAIDLRLLFYGRGSPRLARPAIAAILGEGPVRARILPVPGRALTVAWDHLGWPPVERLLGPIDVLHGPADRLPAARRARSVLTFHSTVALARPDLLDPGYAARFRARWPREEGRADWIAVVSEAARRDLLEHSDFPADRVRTIPLGVSAEFRPPAGEDIDHLLAARFGLRRPYVLYVGGLQKVKNVGGLLAAFAGLVKGGRAPHRLVLAGVLADARDDVRAALADPAVAARVILTGELSPSSGDLPLLYAGADLLVQPSFYEGWASPPLEAMACGTPVAAAAIPALVESCGGAAVHFDPADPPAIAGAIERAIADEGLRKDLVERGFAWSRRWTWDRAARATVDLYRAAAGAGPRGGR